MESAAIDYATKALYLVLMLSMPPIIVASLIGILLSLTGAIRKLQEQALTSSVKLLAAALPLFIMGDGSVVKYSAMWTIFSAVSI